MSKLYDAALRGVYRAGWLLAARVPPRLVRRLTSIGSRLALRHNGSHVRQLRENLSITTGKPASDDLVRAALASYLRNFYEVLALPHWDETQVTSRVTTVGEQTLRTAFEGPGAVVALPHSANWDLAGAWACQTGMPVTTVAEQLAEAEFAAFVGFRERLGMQVLSDRDPGTISTLAGAVRARRLVCLVADRDLLGTGVKVSWRGQPITMPAGPAMVARRTGASLVPAVCRFTADGMRITFGAVVANRPGRDGLTAMTQEVADFFADQIAQQPEDWHLLQPFFTRPAPSPSPPGDSHE